MKQRKCGKLSSVCSIGHIMDDLLAMFNGRWGAKEEWTLLAGEIQHTWMQYVSMYVYTHVGISYTNLMNSVLLAIHSSYSVLLYTYLANFSINLSCCISTVDGRAMAKMDSVTLHNASTEQGRLGLVGGHMTCYMSLTTVYTARLTKLQED